MGKVVTVMVGELKWSAMTMMVVILVVAARGWAQGSRPVGEVESRNDRTPLATSGTTVTASNAGTDTQAKVTRTGTSESLRGYRLRLGVHGKRGGKIVVEEVSFLDKTGKETRRYKQFTKPVRYLLTDLAEAHVIVVEDAPEVEPNGDIVRFLDVSGRELWRATRCCGGDARDNIVMAEDGSVVAVLDMGEGEGCAIGEGIYPAPKGCVGLRIFTAEGKEVFRVPRASEVELSPRGRFALVDVKEKPTILVNLGSRKWVSLPRTPESGAPWAVEDSGVVNYYKGAGWPPGVKGYRYIPGKGLEKVGEK